MKEFIIDWILEWMSGVKKRDVERRSFCRLLKRSLCSRANNSTFLSLNFLGEQRSFLQQKNTKERDKRGIHVRTIPKNSSVQLAESKALRRAEGA